MEFLTEPWPWYVSGPLLGLMVPILFFIGNKHFGVSSSFRHICSAVLKPKADYFRYDWKASAWNLIMLAGTVIGAAVAVLFLNGGEAPAVTAEARKLFAEWSILRLDGLMPEVIFAPENLFSLPALLVLVLGGFLIGFGTRYAGGCTAGHAIMGLSLLNLGSLVAVIGFFAGGLLVAWFVVPWVVGV